MRDGLYLAQFCGPRAVGHGVISLLGNEIAGGDSYHWWTGRIAEGEDGSLNADLTVKQHIAGSDGNLFGFFDSQKIVFSGRHVGEASQFDGQTMVGVPMQMNLRPLHLA
jgi:hypothetical protein